MNQRYIGQFCVKKEFEYMVKILDMQLNINKNKVAIKFKLWDQLLGLVIQVVGGLPCCHVLPYKINVCCF